MNEQKITLEEAASVLGNVAREYQAIRLLREAVEAALGARRAEQEAREQLRRLQEEIPREEKRLAEVRTEIGRIMAKIDA